jgi:hypothetical protein
VEFSSEDSLEEFTDSLAKRLVRIAGKAGIDVRASDFTIKVEKDGDEVAYVTVSTLLTKQMGKKEFKSINQGINTDLKANKLKSGSATVTTVGKVTSHIDGGGDDGLLGFDDLIVGIAIAVMLSIGVLVMTVFCCIRCHQKHMADKASPSSSQFSSADTAPDIQLKPIVPGHESAAAVTIHSLEP